MDTLAQPVPIGNRVRTMTEQETLPARSGTDDKIAIDTQRRAALAKLGLAAAVAYAAPAILHLDRSAKAAVLPSCVPPEGGEPCP